MSDTDTPYHERAATLAREGRVQEALSCYDEALRKNPDNDMILNNKAIALITLGRFEEALATCKKAASLNPDSPDIFTNTGVALERLGRFPEAAEALERATAINPYDCYARALLGIVYQKMNMEELAESQNRQLQDMIFPNEYAGFFFGTAAFLLGMLLGGIRGVEGKPIVITISSQFVIVILFIVICLVYWRSLQKLNQINRNVIVVPYPSPIQGDRSARGMYIVLTVMIVVFVIGIILGNDIWNWL